MKLLKQEVDLLPKNERKEQLKHRKEALEIDQKKREQLFVTKLNDTHETSLKRLSDTHKEKIALLDRQFLQQKQQLLRAREVNFVYIFQLVYMSIIFSNSLLDNAPNQVVGCIIHLGIYTLFSSNYNIHKSSCGLCFRASDLLIDIFY